MQQFVSGIVLTLFIVSASFNYYFYVKYIKKQDIKINNNTTSTSPNETSGDDKSDSNEKKEESSFPYMRISIPFFWKDSVYDKKLDWVNSIANSHTIVVKAVGETTKINVNLLVHCTHVDMKANKIRLHIEDIFGDMWTEWFTNPIPPDRLHLFMGHMVEISGYATNHKLYVQNIKAYDYKKTIV